MSGTGNFVGDAGDPNNAPGQMTNPDWQCVLNATIAQNTNSTWLAELAANKVPLAAGTTHGQQHLNSVRHQRDRRWWRDHRDDGAAAR